MHIDTMDVYNILLPIPEPVMQEIIKRAEQLSKTPVECVYDALCDWLFGEEVNN